ncbi:MAG: hypothetical protein GXP62_16030, partial [Oligoflexia bacterium]|nr:hypothetical protein [Oligoflexia bacterium]
MPWWTSRLALLALLLAGCTSKLSDVDQDGDGVSVADGDCWDFVDGPAGTGLSGDQIYPGAVETWYDGFDQDCAGDSDYDQDADGFVPDAYSAQADGLPAGDCDDTAAQVNPDAADEFYDGVDSDCAGNDDFDQDGDGYVSDSDAGQATQYVEGSGELPGGDCDDLDGGVNPAAVDDWYDGVDTDCAGNDDYDQDGDGYVPLAYDGLTTTYVEGSGKLPGGDCDDTDAGRAPDDTIDVIWYNGYDERCDENDGDQDGDGYWDANYAAKVADSGSGYDPLSIPDGKDGDCFDDLADRPDSADTTNDLVPINGGSLLDPESIHPGADDDSYDGVDADCAGDSDFDKDGDSYDSECVQQRDGSFGSDCLDSDDPADCGDDDPAALGPLGVYPGAIDAWYDGTDANCDNYDDWDQDYDQYVPDGYEGVYTGTFSAGDCDDLDGTVNPGETDRWYDGIDSDCAGDDDYDADVDGDDSDAHGGGDCEDTDSSIYSGAPDTWYDGIDSDCAGDDDYDADVD